MLVRNREGDATGIELLSNVCRHRQSIMLRGRGNAQNIVCPLHRWTYDLKGELLGAPHFPESPCVKLRSKPLTSWNGLLFTGPRDPRRDLARITTLSDWDFSGYVLDSVRVDEYDINWKSFIETYLEVYHVDFFHPGLGNFTDCTNFTVDYGDEYSVQIVAAKAGLRRPGTPVYKRWQEMCLKQLDGREPKHGALWAYATSRDSPSSGIRTCWWSRTSSRERRTAPPTWSSSTIRRRSSCSSASSSRRSRRRTSKPRSRTTRSASASTPAAARCTSRARTTPAPTSRRWKTPRCTSTSGCTASMEQ